MFFDEIIVTNIIEEIPAFRLIVGLVSSIKVLFIADDKESLSFGAIQIQISIIRIST